MYSHPLYLPHQVRIYRKRQLRRWAYEAAFVAGVFSFSLFLSWVH